MVPLPPVPVFYCCVPLCENTNKTVPVHRFPKEDERIQEWCNVIGRQDLRNLDHGALRENYRVCDSHFSGEHRLPEGFRSRSGLLADAIPTLNLGQDQFVVPMEVDDELLVQPDPNNQLQHFEEPEVDPQPGPSGVLVNEEIEMELMRPSTPVELLAQPGPSNLAQHIGEPEGDPQPGPSGVMLNKDIEMELVRPSTPVEGGDGISVQRKQTRRQGIRRKQNFLKRLNVTRANQLTPKAKILYNLARELKKTAADLDRENASNKERLHQALEYAETGQLLAKKVNKATMRFLQSQISLQNKNPRGRRFSTEDKIFALSMLKVSRKGYRALQNVFALPSRQTLMALLNKVPFDCGLNEAILNCLKQSTAKMTNLEKCCILMYDEMSIQSALQYFSKDDYIQGFENLGDNLQRAEFADHVCVFMARGIFTKWKQPVAYFFTGNAMKSTDLVRNITDIIRALRNVGLKVLATVCDQMSANVSANNYLQQRSTEYCLQNHIEKNYFGYLIDGEEVVFLYDGPHLLKGVRNNLLNHDATFKWKKEIMQKARWEDVIRLYEYDSGPDDMKLCSRLTDQHVYPDKIKKMKVKLAAQVLSQRVSSIMRFAAEKDSQNFSETATGTADFLLFFDKLFDSINGSTIEIANGKTLRCAITANSEHLPFWEAALPVLQTIKYVDAKGSCSVPPSINNFSHTVRGIRYLWQKCQAEGAKFLCPRNLNQDPEENFFACVRNCAGRNVNPTAASFCASFKTLVVNNFTSTHSPGSNCEVDTSEGALNTLKRFIDVNSDVNEDLGVQTMEEIEDVIVEGEENFTAEEQNPLTVITTDLHSYIAGYIGKQLLKNIICKTCRNNLIGEERDDLTKARAYHARALVNAHCKFRILFSKSCKIFSFFLPKLCHRRNIGKLMKIKLFKYALDECQWQCDNHNLKLDYSEIFSKFYINAWVNNINKVLRGQDQRNLNDPIKLKAKAKYDKFRGKAKRIAKLKQLV